jgi:hypothetical protein
MTINALEITNKNKYLFLNLIPRQLANDPDTADNSRYRQHENQHQSSANIFHIFDLDAFQWIS